MQEIEEEYENMIYEKEENQIQQESDVNAQLEDVKKVEAMIAAFEKQLKDLERQNKQLDYELSRNNAPSVTSKVSSQNLNKIQGQNLRKLSSIVQGSLASGLRN